MKITSQDYGSSILLFIKGSTPAEAYGKYLSFYNWNATSSEPSYVADHIISCWTTKEKLQKYFLNKAADDMIVNGTAQFRGKKGGFADIIKDKAAKDYAAIETETYRSMNSSFSEHILGTIIAEKPDDDFKSSVLSFAFANK